MLDLFVPRKPALNRRKEIFVREYEAQCNKMDEIC